MNSQDQRPVVPFNRHVQVESLDAPPGMGRTQIPDIIELRNHFGTVHGSALFTVGEVAAGAAMTRLLGTELGRLRAITREANIKYLKPARGVINAEACVGLDCGEILRKVDADDSVSVPIRVELKDSSGAVIAEMAVTWFVGKPKPLKIP
jgi:acyl-coenzyme A thioesterase PaaI-like protein